MSDLNILREQIDNIDAQIVKLLCERFDTVKNVAEYKKANGLEILQKSREAKVLSKIDGREYQDYIVEIYKVILETSKRLQGGIHGD